MHLKEFNKLGINGKPKAGGILNLKLFWIKEDLKLMMNWRWKFSTFTVK